MLNRCIRIMPKRIANVFFRMTAERMPDEAGVAVVELAETSPMRSSNSVWKIRV